MPRHQIIKIDESFIDSNVQEFIILHLGQHGSNAWTTWRCNQQSWVFDSENSLTGKDKAKFPAITSSQEKCRRYQGL